MNTVNLDAILGSARNVVKSAKKEGRFDHITARIVRQQVERTLSLPEGFLDAEQYKSRVKSVVDETIEELDSSESEEIFSAISLQKRTNIMSKKRKSDEHTNAESDSNKKAKVNEDDSSAKQSLTAKRRQQEFKSKEFIGSSEDEDDGVHESGNSKIKVAKSDLLIASSSGPSTVADNKALKREILDSPAKDSTLLTESVKVTQKKNKLNTNSVKNKSEQVAKKSKVKEKTETTRTSKPKQTIREKKGRKMNAKELSPDEETIKRLKALVFACGIRKNWKKELQNSDTPMSQITHIKSVLRDLGMSGRMSMEQAKAIKAKREFEQEMKDVLEFAGKHSTAVKSENENTSENDSDSNSESDTASDAEAGEPRKRRQKLSNVDSLQAFLANQSDDE